MRKSIHLLFLSFALLILSYCNKDKSAITNSFKLDTSIVHVHKPNIYICPTENIELNVYLSFPMGGSIVQSIPMYGNGWSVFVDASGLIDNEFDYLFYECQVPNFFQKENGWIIKQENLEAFFRENLTQIGFVEPEIEDFIEYWIPILNYSSEYILYPQYSKDILPLIELTLSKQPECMLRYFYLIEENLKGISTLESPIIPEFNRNGFTVAEWGVIIY